MVKGPATKPLEELKVTVEGDNLTVTLSVYGEHLGHPVGGAVGQPGIDRQRHELRRELVRPGQAAVRHLTQLPGVAQLVERGDPVGCANPGRERAP